MANLTQTKNTVNTYVNGKLAGMVTQQDTYLASNGKCWQGTKTHTIVPTHTSAVSGAIVPDRLASAPSDQGASWLTYYSSMATDLMPASLVVHTYDGPSGKGWIVTADMIFNSIRYRKVWNTGPEAYRAYDWTVIVLV